MGAQGTATLDFGAFPGASDASVAVTGQTGITAGSLVEAWLFPATTADHSPDEHILETIKVVAHTIVAGTGFTITGINTSEIFEPLEPQQTDRFRALAASGSGGTRPMIGGIGTRIYGQWNVGWVWN